MRKIKFLNIKYFNKRGFTLVELLVSLLIISTIGTVVFSIVWISLRSIVKVNNSNLIRQNGNFAITQITKMLQFASKFEGLSNDGTNFSISCRPPGSASIPTYRYIRFTAPDNGVVTFGCLNSPPTIASNSSSLINTTTYTVSSCNFTCIKASTNTPYTIGVEYTLEKRPSGSLFDDPSPVEFKTSVTVRNFRD